MPRLRHMLLNLGVVLTIAGTLLLSGCTGTNGQATEQEVNNNAFTFPTGTVFNPALTGATTLEFTNNANTFTLFSFGGIASGNNRFGSCILTVGTSTYAPGAGPQVNDVITLNPCTFDSSTNTLTVSNGPITATSNPAITRLVNATPNEVNNASFLFASGQVFNALLVNVPVILAFTNNANSFTLTSFNNTSNNASGNSTIDPGVPSGSCTLTVTKTSFTTSTGPQLNDVITLSPCQFNSANGTLTISNGTISITSNL